MKKLIAMIMGMALPLIAVAGPEASLNPAQVGAPAIHCLYNPACTNLVEDSYSPIALPGTVGTGFLHTRVILGESNAPAAGHFGYEYRIDLSGVSLAPGGPPCFTNVLLCLTNRVKTSHTNVVVCRTNVMGGAIVVNCVTNRIPGTNLVTCVTNAFPATNQVQCLTNPAGATVCFTNEFPATNYVVCFTNRVPARSIVNCQTNRFPGGTVVICTTNRVIGVTNRVTCTTNTIPCPESTPCISSFSIYVGPGVTRLDFDTNGSSSDQVYVITTGGLGGVAPAEVALNDGNLVLRFSPPLCPGDSSLTVGLVSPGAPRDRQARLTLTTGIQLEATARAPQEVEPLNCDFRKLTKEVQHLSLRDIVGSNNSTREARRTALLDLVQAAEEAAAAGNVEQVIAALSVILDKTDGGSNCWLTTGAARKVNKIIFGISKCLADDGHHGGGGKDDEGKHEDKEQRNR